MDSKTSDIDLVKRYAENIRKADDSKALQEIKTFWANRFEGPSVRVLGAAIEVTGFQFMVSNVLSDIVAKVKKEIREVRITGIDTLVVDCDLGFPSINIVL